MKKLSGFARIATFSWTMLTPDSSPIRLVLEAINEGFRIFWWSRHFIYEWNSPHKRRILRDPLCYQVFVQGFFDSGSAFSLIIRVGGLNNCHG